MTLTIVSREQWGARYDDGAGPAPLPAREVWLHHSVTIAPDLVPPFDDEDAAMRVLEQIGQDRFAQGVSYTFAVMPTGRVFEGHGIGRLGAHTGGRNSIARAIVLVGNYDEDEPTAAQIEATAQLLVDGQRDGWWTAARLNGGHQQAPGASTACPGRHAMAAIGAINARASALAAGAASTLEDDMYGPNERDELVKRLDRLQTGLDGVFRTVGAIHVGVNDPSSGTRNVVLQLAGRDPVEVDARELAAAMVPLLAPALAAKTGTSREDIEDVFRSVLGGLDGVTA